MVSPAPSFPPDLIDLWRQILEKLDELKPPTQPGPRPANPGPGPAPPTSPAPRPAIDQPGKDTPSSFNPLKVAFNAYADLGRSIRGLQESVRQSDYVIGQMSRRYINSGQINLQQYRQNISDLTRGTGMTQEENIQFTDIAGRFGRGTSRIANTVAQQQQTRDITQAAFNLGMNRQGLASTLDAVGRAGAVGAAGRAGGQMYDMREFAAGIGEALAAGQLFDRMDDVMKSIADMTTIITQRGGIVDPLKLASAMASTNLGAIGRNDARMQEMSAQNIGNIDKITATKKRDALFFGASLMASGKTGDIGLADFVEFQEKVTGGDIIAKAEIISSVAKNSFGVDLSKIQNNKPLSQQDPRILEGLYGVQEIALPDMGTQQMFDTLKAASDITQGAGQQQIDALQKNAQYIGLSNSTAKNLYASANFAQGENLSNIIGRELEKTKDTAFLSSGEKDIRAQMQAAKALADTGNIEGARSSFLNVIAQNQDSRMIGAGVGRGNALEEPKIQAQELNQELETAASKVNQTAAEFDKLRVQAELLRGALATIPGFAEGAVAADRARESAGTGGLLDAFLASKLLKGGLDTAKGFLPAGGLAGVPAAAAAGFGIVGAGIGAGADYLSGLALDLINPEFQKGDKNDKSWTRGSGGALARILAGTATAAAGGAAAGTFVVPVVGTGAGALIAGAGGLAGSIGMEAYGLYKNGNLTGGRGGGMGEPEIGGKGGGTGEPVMNAGISAAEISSQLTTSNDLLSKIAKLIAEQISLQSKPGLLSPIMFAETTVGKDNKSGLFRSSLTPTVGSSLPAHLLDSSGKPVQTNGSGQYAQAIAAASQKSGIPAEMIAAMIQTESGFNAGSIGDNGNSFGLGQIQLATAREIDPTITQEQLMDPLTNIRMMGEVLARKRMRVGDNVDDIIRAYNGSGSATYAYLNKVKANVGVAMANPNVSGGMGSGVGVAGQVATSGGQGGGRFIPIARNGQLRDNVGINTKFWQWYDIVDKNTGKARSSYNLGTDYRATHEDQAVAPISGTVISLNRAEQADRETLKDAAGKIIDPTGGGYVREYGNSVAIMDDEGTIHRLSHLSNLNQNLKIGGRVDAGTVFGNIGMTGFATGEHLDWETWQKALVGGQEKYALMDSEKWRQGIWAFGQSAYGGQAVTVAQGTGHGAYVVDPRVVNAQGGGAGEPGIPQKMEVVIRLEQDENGKIVGVLSSPQNVNLAFNKSDPLGNRMIGDSPTPFMYSIPLSVGTQVKQ